MCKLRVRPTDQKLQLLWGSYIVFGHGCQSRRQQAENWDQDVQLQGDGGGERQDGQHGKDEYYVKATPETISFSDSQPARPMLVLHVKLQIQQKKNSGNESKILLTSKISLFYAHILPFQFLIKKHMNLSNFPDTPRLFFCAGCYEKLVIL